MSATTVEGATGTDVPVTVRLRGIGKRFPGVIANDDVNIDVRRGTVHPGTVFYDPNGHVLLVYKVDTTWAPCSLASSS